MAHQLIDVEEAQLLLDGNPVGEVGQLPKLFRLRPARRVLLPLAHILPPAQNPRSDVVQKLLADVQGKVFAGRPHVLLLGLAELHFDAL